MLFCLWKGKARCGCSLLRGDTVHFWTLPLDPAAGCTAACSGGGNVTVCRFSWSHWGSGGPEPRSSPLKVRRDSSAKCADNKRCINPCMRSHKAGGRQPAWCRCKGSRGGGGGDSLWNVVVVIQYFPGKFWLLSISLATVSLVCVFNDFMGLIVTISGYLFIFIYFFAVPHVSVRICPPAIDDVSCTLFLVVFF